MKHYECEFCTRTTPCRFHKAPLVLDEHDAEVLMNLFRELDEGCGERESMTIAKQVVAERSEA